MKTPRELILERHESAETKLKTIRGEDLAACVRSAAQASPQRLPALDLAAAVKRFWQDTFGPWRRAWIGIGVVWFGLLVFSLASGESPRTGYTKPPQPDPGVVTVLRVQKELLTQLLGSGDSPLISRLQRPGPRSAAEPPTGRNESAGRLETTVLQSPCAQV